jgi:hypothetical protein
MCEARWPVQAVLEIEECDSTMFELRADDSPSRQTEAVSIKSERSLQIVDAESNDCDPWFHSRTDVRLRRVKTKKCETGYGSERKVSTFRSEASRVAQYNMGKA